MRIFLTCVLLITAAGGCDEGETTAAPTSVPPAPDLSAVPAGTDMAQAPGAGDMATSPTFPTTASVTVGANNTLSFSPASVDIAAGGTVTWTWASGITMPHNVTSADTPARFPSSPTQMSGSYQFTFSAAGSYPYYCTVHGRNVMSGTVVVH